MSAKNIHNDAVIEALVADGWSITDDPLSLEVGGRDMWVDLGAEKDTLLAEKGEIRIAVEVASFVGNSPILDLQKTLG